MIIEREDNSALYFIVGGLLVAVAAFAIFYFAGDRTPADRTAEGPTIVERIAPAAGNDNESSSTTLSVGEDGVSATTTETR